VTFSLALTSTPVVRAAPDFEGLATLCLSSPQARAGSRRAVLARVRGGVATYGCEKDCGGFPSDRLAPTASPARPTAKGPFRRGSLFSYMQTDTARHGVGKGSISRKGHRMALIVERPRPDRPPAPPAGCGLTPPTPPLQLGLPTLDCMQRCMRTRERK